MLLAFTAASGSTRSSAGNRRLRKNLVLQVLIGARTPRPSGRKNLGLQVGHWVPRTPSRSQYNEVYDRYAPRETEACLHRVRVLSSVDDVLNAQRRSSCMTDRHRPSDLFNCEPVQ